VRHRTVALRVLARAAPQEPRRGMRSGDAAEFRVFRFDARDFAIEALAKIRDRPADAVEPGADALEHCRKDY
jgi:hypothetical protein